MAENGVKKVLPYISLVGVIVVAVGAGIAWGGQDKTVQDHERRLQKVEDAIVKQGETAAVLNERTKETQKDVQEIKSDIKRVLTEVLKRRPGRQ